MISVLRRHAAGRSRLRPPPTTRQAFRTRQSAHRIFVSIQGRGGTYLKQKKKSNPRRHTKNDEGTRSETALPNGKGCGPASRRAPPGEARVMGECHLGARASRPHALPLRAAQFPCDGVPGHPGGGNAMGSAGAESWRRCRSSGMEEMAEAVPRRVRAGRPRSQVGLHPMTSSHQRRPIDFRVYSCSFVVRLQ